MKKLIALTIAILTAFPVVSLADGYSSLWKQFTKAQQKDQPQTELKILQTISEKATADKSYGNLLKAETIIIGIKSEVSPDSLAPLVTRMEQTERNTEDPVLQAVYCSLLGKIYAITGLGEDANAKSKEYFERSLQNPDLLAAQTTKGYVPFIDEEADSRIFYDDLLHVLGLEAENYKLLRDYYATHNNRPATCICDLKLLQQQRTDYNEDSRKSKYLQSLDSLIKIYSDLPEAGELAIARYEELRRSSDVSAEQKYNYINYALQKWGTWRRMNALRNAMRELTQPSFNISLGTGVELPNRSHKVLINSLRNISELTMNIYKLRDDVPDDLNPNDAAEYKKLMDGSKLLPEASKVMRHYGQPEYEEITDSLSIPGLPLGLYMVEFTTNNREIKAEHELLRVSDLQILWQNLVSGYTRFAVVNATTGAYVPHATIKLKYDNKGVKTETYQTDEKGEYLLKYNGQRYWNYEVKAETTEDRYDAYRPFYAGTHFGDRDETISYQQLYTDRSLYRPGQKVHVAAICFQRYADDAVSVESNKKITFKLRDANYKQIAQQEVTTDAFGTASADFTLPNSGLTGRFSISTEKARTYFSVEEYKRPTFEVTFDDYKGKYEEGDTVTLTGHAKSYAGVPVQGAKVSYKVKRTVAWWWWRSDNSNATLLTDTVQTDEKGSFKVKVPVVMPKNLDWRKTYFYAFQVNANVTDVSGETHEGTTSLPFGTKPTAFTTDMPDKSPKDSLRTIAFSYKNNAGKDIPGTVRYRIDNQSFTAKANEKVDISSVISSLSSGRHELFAVCGNDTIKKNFIVFTMQDTKPVVDTPDWFYVSSRTFPADGKPVYVQIGSSADTQYVLYTIETYKTVLEKGSLDLNGKLITRTFTYKPEYGDGITVNYVWVKNGKVYAHSERIQKPLPDKRLITKWTTFRDRLTPGQKEEWTLNITRPGGKAVSSQLLATLYDKSLDAIRPHKWHLALNFHRYLSFSSWKGTLNNGVGVYGFENYSPLPESPLTFSNYDSVLGLGNIITKDEIFIRGMSDSALGRTNLSRVALAKTAAPLAGTLSENSVTELNSKPAMAADNVEVSDEKPQLRENFDETAFFYPNLLTDGKGNVSIKFTLPESITTWHFMGLAHDKDLNYAIVDSQAVAKKEVMVQPNVPRFVRSGDKVTITSKIFNTSDHAVKGTVRMEILDAETQKVIDSQSQKFSVAQDSTATATFSYAPKDADAMLICRIIASGKNFSDGEQHYLPVLPDKEQVINTLPFTLEEAGTKTFDVAQLFPDKTSDGKLTVEYTNNPAWLMIQTLPSVASPNEKNAISLVTAYYANSLASYILGQSPNIKQTLQMWQRETGKETSLMSNLEKNQDLKTLLINETPWVMDAERESDQKQQLLDYFDENLINFRLKSSLSSLQKLQRMDGGFSWWPGMDSSPYMTMTVAETMTRLYKLIGKKQDTQMVNRAFSFMDKFIAKEVKELKKAASKGEKNLAPSELACHYLYSSALYGRAKTADMDYLVDLLAKMPTKLTIYGKANSAIILSLYQHRDRAMEYLQSMKEYTVYKEEMGRYFDTPKAQYTWCDYRIPSQVAAIEALQTLTPNDTKFIHEMQRWLLQAKRTQSWDTPINCVNAVYAFLNGQMNRLSAENNQPAVITVDGKQMEMSKATASLGYTKGTKQGDDIRQVTVQKNNSGTSWGALYASFMQPSVEVKGASAGLTVKREVLNGTSALKVGDRIKVRITITADRDYDFVQLQDKRAACLEPVGQLSGYHWGYYCTPLDNATNYYFDRLSKGKHVIETEYYVDRIGDYHSGICTVQCAYSPEFMAREAAFNLTIK